MKSQNKDGNYPFQVKRMWIFIEDITTLEGYAICHNDEKLVKTMRKIKYVYMDYLYEYSSLISTLKKHKTKNKNYYKTLYKSEKMIAIINSFESKVIQKIKKLSQYEKYKDMDCRTGFNCCWAKENY